MEEQAQAPSQQRSRKSLAIVLTIAIIAGIAAYLLLAGGGTDPARYLPKEVAVAATVDFTKSADKDAALDVIRGVFKDAGMASPEKELFKALKDELDLDFEKDVLARLDGTGAGAILTEMNGMMPVMVAVLCTRTDRDAADLVKIVQDKLTLNKIGFQKLSYKGFDYCRIAASTRTPDMPFAGPQLVNYVGAVKSGIVWANSEGGFKKVIDTIKGEPSILKDANFTRLRETRPSTFATMYVSGPGYYKLISPTLNMSMGMMGGEVPSELKEQMENAVAVVCTADASGEGLRFETLGLTQKPGPQYGSVSLEDMAKEIPASAKIAFGVKGLDMAWMELKRTLLSNPMYKKEVDQALVQAKQMLGFDPLADLLDRFKDLTIYYVPGRMANSSAFPGAATIVVTVDKPEVVRKSLEKIHVFAAATGQVKVSRASAGGQQVSVIALSQNDVKLGDALVGDKLAITICGPDVVKTMAATVSSVKGKGATLATSPDYQFVKKQLPDKGVGLIYGDVGGIVDAFKADIPSGDRKKVEAAFRHVGWFGATGEVRGTESTSISVVPFKK